jgi:hypothetical protein
VRKALRVTAPVALVIVALVFALSAWLSSFAAASPGEVVSPRHRIQLAQLSPGDRSKVQKCDATAKKLLATSPGERMSVALELLDDAKDLTTSAPDYFMGWFWLGESSLLLDDPESGARAGTNMIALGVIENHSVKILSLMAALEDRGWLPKVQTRTAETKSGSSQSPWAKPVSQNLTAEDRLEFETLTALATQADQGSDPERKTLTGLLQLVAFCFRTIKSWSGFAGDF